MNLSHPMLESVFLPLLAALVLAGGIRSTLGVRMGTRLAASGAGIALLFALVLILGDPVWPPRTGLEKLAPVFAALLIAGVGIDVINPERKATYVVGIIGIAMTVLWLGWPVLSRGDHAELLPALAASVLALAALAALLRADPVGVNRPSMVVMAALGLAGAGLNAGSLLLFQLALAVAAAVGGFALWSWPKPRLPFSAAGLLPAGIGGFAIALLILLITEIRPWALLPLVLVFLGDALAKRIPVPGTFQRATIEPLYIMALGSIGAVAAVLLAQAPSSGDELYYR